MSAQDYGVGSGWAGIRTTKSLVQKFNGTNNPPTAWTDARAMFFTNGQEYEISSISNFKQVMPLLVQKHHFSRCKR